MGTKYGFTIEAGLTSNHLTDAHYIKGGYCVVKDIDERNKMVKATDYQDGTVVEGSLCYVQSHINEDGEIVKGKFYKYNGTSWEEADFGSGGGGVSGGGGELVEDYESLSPTENLNYTLLDDGTYSVSGMKRFPYTEVVIPSTYNGVPVTRIADAGFGYSTLTSVVIGNNVTSVGETAFAYCENLKRVIIGKGVKTIGKWAFNGCFNVTNIDFYATAMEDLSDDNNVFVYTGDEIEGIKVYIGANVTKIPNNLFYPSKAEIIWSDDGTYEIDGYSPNITHVNFAKGSVCSIIGTRAFKTTGLAVVVLPDSVNIIGDAAFSHCSALVSIEIPYGVQEIGSCAFESCQKLNRIVLPPRILKIGASAFRGCEASIFSPEPKAPDAWDSTWAGDCTVMWNTASDLDWLTKAVQRLYENEKFIYELLFAIAVYEDVSDDVKVWMTQYEDVGNLYAPDGTTYNVGKYASLGDAEESDLYTKYIDP